MSLYMCYDRGIIITLKDNLHMKYWILGIIRLSTRLCALCERIDKQIERLSVNLIEDTHKLIDAILMLQDRKIRLINFGVLNQRMRLVLTPEEETLLVRRGAGEALGDIGIALGISRNAAAKKIQKAVGKCSAVAEDLGFTEKQLMLHYRDIPIIYNTVTGLQENEDKRLLPRVCAYSAIVYK